MVLLLSGCLIRPEVKARPVEPPRAFASARQAAAAPAVGRFWRLFGDPALDRLVERALQKNLDLELAAARLQEAGASLVAARSGWFPTVAAKGEVSHSQRTIELPDFTGQGGDNIKRDVTSTSYSISLQASYEIDLWGKVRHGYTAAKKTLEAAQEDLRAARISVAATLVEGYFAAVELRAQIALSRQTVTSRESHLEVVARRYREGVVTSLDLYQAQENLARARSAIPSLEARLLTTEHAIAVLAGEFPRAGMAGTLDRLPPPIRELPPGLPAQLLLRRPDLRAAHARLVAADATVARAVAAHYPGLSLSGSLGVSFDPASFIWSILGSLAAPLFNGMAISAEVDRQEARLLQALVAYKATLLKALQDVEDALVTGRKQAERVTLLEQRAEVAEGTLRLSTEQYLQGLVPFINVLTAEQSVYSAKAELITARRELISARLKLARALAGDWSAGGDRAAAEETRDAS